MAARATRSASRKARLTEAVATGPLGALSHDELGVIVDGLADPLQPVVAVALSSTCLGLRTPLWAALEVLKERHERAVALCRKVGVSCAALHGAERLDWDHRGLTADDKATLGMLLSKWLPRLQEIYLNYIGFGDTGMRALCEGLGRGAAPSILTLMLDGNKFGPAGAEALAAALHRGAMPKLDMLSFHSNPIGNQGIAALAATLRQRPALQQLSLARCEIGDEGVASLVANLGKDDFGQLEKLYLSNNKITDAGCATLSRALDDGVCPPLQLLTLANNPASEAARQAVRDALSRARARVRLNSHPTAPTFECN